MKFSRIKKNNLAGVNLPNLDIPIPNQISPKLKKNIIINLISKLKNKKVYIPLSLFIFLTLIYTNQLRIIKFLNQIGVLNVMRTTGIIKPPVTEFFEAMKTQNLVYDYNNDGAVTGEDWEKLVAARKIIQPTPTPVPSTPTPTPLPGNPAPLPGGRGGILSEENPAVGENPNVPSVRGFGTDEFTGSVTSGYSFILPPGPASFAPALSLSYSSGAVDDLLVGVETQYRNDQYHPYQKQAGIFGLGWSLNGIGFVARDTKGTLNDLNDDTFMLVFGGGSANLTYESGNSIYSTWRTVPNLKVKVERYGLCKTYNSENVCRYRWLITDGSGNRHYFGSNSADSWKRDNDPDKNYFAEGSGNSWYTLYSVIDSKNIGTRAWLIYGSNTRGYHALEYKWLPDISESVYDGTFDVSIAYQSVFGFGDYGTDEGIKKYTRGTRPETITYGANKVEFIYEPRLDYQTHQEDNPNPQQPLNIQSRVKKIKISTSNTAVRSYVFDYVYGYDSTKQNPNNVVPGQVIHSLLQKITPWSGDAPL